MEDDLFDVLGFSHFTSDDKWCLLNSDPCVPLPDCEEHRVGGQCVYESEEDEESR